MHYARPDAKDEAKALLKFLIDRGPCKDLYRHGLFWLARVHEAAGDNERAQARFQQLAQDGTECPEKGIKRFDYYAIRARMHLNMGPEASGAVLAGRGDVGLAASRLRTGIG